MLVKLPKLAAQLVKVETSTHDPIHLVTVRVLGWRLSWLVLKLSAKSSMKYWKQGVPLCWGVHVTAGPWYARFLMGKSGTVVTLVMSRSSTR